MRIGVLSFDFLIPESKSLKYRRTVANKIIQSLKKRYNVSVAMKPSDHRQRVTLHVVYVNSNTSRIDKTLDSIWGYVQSLKYIELLDQGRELF